MIISEMEIGGRMSFIIFAVFLIMSNFIKAQQGGNPAQWRQAGFSGTIFKTVNLAHYDGRREKLPYRLDLSVVVFRGSGWNQKQIIQRLVKTTQIYRQCKVNIGRINFVVTSPPSGYLSPKRYQGDSRKFADGKGSYLKLAKIMPSLKKPVLIYLDGQSTNFSKPFAISLKTARSNLFGRITAMTNMAWMSYYALEFERKPKYGATNNLISRGFVTEAHELGHLLLNEGGHISRQNLMGNSYSKLNDQLSSEQCLIIQNSPLILK